MLLDANKDIALSGQTRGLAHIVNRRLQRDSTTYSHLTFMLNIAIKYSLLIDFVAGLPLFSFQVFILYRFAAFSQLTHRRNTPIKFPMSFSSNIIFRNLGIHAAATAEDVGLVLATVFSS